MKEYREFIRGLPQFAPQIANARAYLEMGGISQRLFYPMVPLRDEEDGFDVVEMEGLPEGTIMVVSVPGGTPEEVKARLDGDNWAYQIVNVGVTGGTP